MRRKNLIKGILCGLMLTTVLGSVAYAKTDSREFYVGTTNKSSTFYGSNGAYGMDLRKDGFIVQTCSQSSNAKCCALEASCISYYDGRVIYRDNAAKTLKKFEGLAVGIVRDNKNPFVDFRGSAVTYNGNHYTSGVLDNFTCTFYQRSEMK